MENDKKCNVFKCIWSCKLELFGAILIVIATLLTIVSLDSLGIVAMFIVGAALCAHKCFNTCNRPQADMPAKAKESRPRPRRKPNPPKDKEPKV